MNQLPLGRLAGLSAVVAVLAATALVVNAAAAGTVKPDSCPTNKPLVVDSYGTFENSADYGADGHVWALDAGTHFIQIWSLGGNAFCVKVHDIGTSTTFAGPSPEGTGNVRAGVSASFDGTVYMRYYGTLAPTVPTTGFIGDFDFRCSQVATSPLLDARQVHSVRGIGRQAAIANGEPQHAGEHADRVPDVTRRQARRDQACDPRLHLSVLDLDQRHVAPARENVRVTCASAFGRAG